MTEILVESGTTLPVRPEIVTHVPGKRLVRVLNVIVIVLVAPCDASLCPQLCEMKSATNIGARLPCAVSIEVTLDCVPVLTMLIAVEF